MSIRNMDPTIREQWLTDLEDGTRTQGTGYLRGKSGNQCCLDVLCEQAVKAGVIAEPVLQYYDSNAFHYHWNDGEGRERLEDGLLPQPVISWAGLEDNNPKVHYMRPYDPDIDEDDYEPDPAGMYELAELNDSLGLSFKEIANLIRNEALLGPEETNGILPAS